MMFNLENRVAVITGAASGMGRDAAIAYAEHGADVALLDRTKERIETLAEEIIKKTGRKALPVECDVSSEENIIVAVDAIISEFGKIDILLNNAGIFDKATVEEITLSKWRESMAVNVDGIFLMCKYIIPHMRKQKYGKIVNISSIESKIAVGDYSEARHAYNTSKAAILGLTLGLATTYAPDNITVNSIAPGLFRTEMTEASVFYDPEIVKGYVESIPMKRHANNGELNGTVLYLSSDASSYSTGNLIFVDGGITLL